MGLKEQVEELCKRAIENEGEDILFNLPRAPSTWTQHKIDERFFQLYHLFKRNGCDISKINLTDYKVKKSIEEYIPPNKKKNG